LTTTEILEVIRRLNETGRTDLLKLLHFHIGSQLTDINELKRDARSGADVF
jgi:arginine decarboxylase-like protein